MKQKKSPNIRKRKSQIKDQVDKREIKYLVHFTPIDNLQSILKFGLRSRKYLEDKKINFTPTDNDRLDHRWDRISASVSFPNYSMFYHKRCSMVGIKLWAVILIRKEALWELDCQFFPKNAANSEMSKFTGTDWSSAQAFKDMFGQEESRRKYLLKYYTTDPQAEVMIKNTVPTDYISEVHLEPLKMMRERREQAGLAPTNLSIEKYLKEMGIVKKDSDAYRDGCVFGVKFVLGAQGKCAISIRFKRELFCIRPDNLKRDSESNINKTDTPEPPLF